MEGCPGPPCVTVGWLCLAIIAPTHGPLLDVPQLPFWALESTLASGPVGLEVTTVPSWRWDAAPSLLGPLNPAPAVPLRLTLQFPHSSMPSLCCQTLGAAPTRMRSRLREPPPEAWGPESRHARHACPSTMGVRPRLLLTPLRHGSPSCSRASEGHGLSDALLCLPLSRDRAPASEAGVRQNRCP